MQKTGMIRRLDELGRIVIPKEIRLSLGLKTGSALQISVDNSNEIILTTHNVMQSLSGVAKDLCDVINMVINKPFVICDRCKIIAVSRCPSRLINTEISKQLKECIDTYNINNGGNIANVPLNDENHHAYAQLIICGATCEGAVVVVDNQMDDIDKLMLKFVSAYLSKQME